MGSFIGIKRLLTDSYLALILLSILAVSSIWQWKYFVFWLLILTVIGTSGAVTAYPLRKLCLDVAGSQVPGVLLAVGSFFDTMSGHTNEWLAGLLEIWVHPYLILLEQIPPIAGIGWSTAYLLACCVPLTPALVVALVYVGVSACLRLFGRSSVYVE